MFQISHYGSVDEAIPVLRIDEVIASLPWYRRLGYEQEWQHRFEPGFPAFVSVARDGGARLFLSEHTGDARADTLVYLRVDNLHAVAQEFDSEILEQP